MIDLDDDPRNAPVYRKSMIGALAIAGLATGIAVFGLDGNLAIRGGFFDEAGLLIAGKRYEAHLQCDAARNRRLGASLMRGFAGLDKRQLRAWSDKEARAKADRGAPAGCRIGRLYRLERMWFSKQYDYEIRI